MLKRVLVVVHICDDAGGRVDLAVEKALSRQGWCGCGAFFQGERGKGLPKWYAFPINGPVAISSYGKRFLESVGRETV